MRSSYQPVCLLLASMVWMTASRLVVAQGVDPFSDPFSLPFPAAPPADDPFGAPPRPAPAEELGEAHALYRKSQSRIPTGDSPEEKRRRSMLGKITEAEFSKAPLAEIAESLADYHICQIRVMPALRRQELTLPRQRSPFCLVLQQMCERLQADWASIGPVLVMGSPQYLEDYRRMAEGVQNKLTHAKRFHAALAETLAEDTSIEFINVPLSDAVQYLSDLHDTRVVVDPPHAAISITAKCKGESLAWALDEALLEHQLTWTITDDAITIIPLSPAHPPAGAAGPLRSGDSSDPP